MDAGETVVIKLSDASLLVATLSEDREDIIVIVYEGSSIVGAL